MTNEQRYELLTLLKSDPFSSFSNECMSTLLPNKDTIVAGPELGYTTFSYHVTFTHNPEHPGQMTADVPDHEADEALTELATYCYYKYGGKVYKTVQEGSAHLDRLEKFIKEGEGFEPPLATMLQLGSNQPH